MRTRTRSSGPLRFATCVLLVIAAACETPPKVVPSGDVPDAPKLARATANALLQLSAYDYALAGSLAGEKARIVSSDRWAAIARGLIPKLKDVTSASLSATANAAGPVRDAVVSLADALNDLTKDASSYADAGDPGVFAKTVGDVNLAWERVQLLAVKLPLDTELQKTVARGRSFVVSTKSEALFALQAGPYATAADADAAAKRIGTVIAVTRVAPFVVRVATYPAKTQADAAAAALKPKGIDVTTVVEERAYTFARSGSAPDLELWREPARVIDGPGQSRRVALSADGKWIALGTDDGYVAIFDLRNGALTALPKLVSGISALTFSSDGAWLFAGGASATVLFVPQGSSPLGPLQRMQFPSAITQVFYNSVPTGRAFVAISRGPTGLSGGGGGLIGARAPDGALLGEPFPITIPAAGGFIAVSDRGEVFIATTSAGNTDIEVLRLGAERFLRGVVKIPGTVQDLAIDPKGDRAAVVTDRGTYRFSAHDADPGATLTRVGPTVRDVAFGADGTFFQVDKDKATATGTDGVLRWQAALTDGRRVVPGLRTLVLDAADTIWAINAEGTIDQLGLDGQVQDVVVSSDGKRVAVVVDGRRALLFDLQ